MRLCAIELASSETNLTATLVAALLGLVVALLLQVFVIPLVQRRSRRRERWESALSELRAVVDVELHDAIAAFQSSDWNDRVVKVTQSLVGPLKSELLARNTVDTRAADKTLSSVYTRISRLSDRVRSGIGEPLAEAHVRDLDRLVRDVRLKVVLPTGLGIERSSIEAAASEVQNDMTDLVDRINEVITPFEAELDEATADAEHAREALLRFIEPIATSMRSPRPLRQALRRRLAPLGRAIMKPVTWTHARLQRLLDKP